MSTKQTKLSLRKNKFIVYQFTKNKNKTKQNKPLFTYSFRFNKPFLEINSRFNVVYKVKSIKNKNKNNQNSSVD